MADPSGSAGPSTKPPSRGRGSGAGPSRASASAAGGTGRGASGAANRGRGNAAASGSAPSPGGGQGGGAVTTAPPTTTPATTALGSGSAVGGQYRPRNQTGVAPGVYALDPSAHQWRGTGTSGDKALPLVGRNTSGTLDEGNAGRVADENRYFGKLRGAVYVELKMCLEMIILILSKHRSFNTIKAYRILAIPSHALRS